MNGKEIKPLSYSRMPTNEYEKYDDIEISLFLMAIIVVIIIVKSYKNHQWMLKLGCIKFGKEQGIYLHRSNISP